MLQVNHTYVCVKLTHNFLQCMSTFTPQCFKFFFSFCSSLPVECLHTILLGPNKHLTGLLMSRLAPPEKDQIMARIRAFPYSGFKGRLSYNICRYHGSFSLAELVEGMDNV